ncbi:MAG: hypothetical protein ACKOPQ_06700 [Novosphingobium sp.]
MNDYQAVSDQLRARRKGKPGELMLVLGVVIALAGPFAAALSRESAAKLAQIKAEGMVTQALVKTANVRSESYTDRKGRTKTRELHELGVEHDLNAQLPYVEWKAGKPFPQPRYKAVTSVTLDVGEAAYDRLPPGTITTIARLPSDYKSTVLTERVERETAFGYMLAWYLGAAAAVAAGLALAIAGWRRRKAALQG